MLTFMPIIGPLNSRTSASITVSQCIVSVNYSFCFFSLPNGTMGTERILVVFSPPCTAVLSSLSSAYKLWQQLQCSPPWAAIAGVGQRGSCPLCPRPCPSSCPHRSPCIARCPKDMSCFAPFPMPLALPPCTLPPRSKNPGAAHARLYVCFCFVSKPLATVDLLV